MYISWVFNIECIRVRTYASQVWFKDATGKHRPRLSKWLRICPPPSALLLFFNFLKLLWSNSLISTVPKVSAYKIRPIWANWASTQGDCAALSFAVWVLNEQLDCKSMEIKWYKYIKVWLNLWLYPRHIRVVLILSRSLLGGGLVSRHSASSRLQLL